MWNRAVIALTGAGLIGAAAVGGGTSRGPDWSVQVSTAAGAPQDVWFAGHGNNFDGWFGGGSICLGPLAQGFAPGDSITIQIDIAAAGLFGLDGQPAAPGVYTAPGIDLPDREFTITNGESFFIILDGFVVHSSAPAFFPPRTETALMFTFDLEPGRNDVEVVLWMPDGMGGWFPFLNEGVMMANVRMMR